MLKRLYGDLSVYDRERIIKFLLCTIAGFAAAYLIGDAGGATTAVTANLILYIDRGFLGSIRYGWKRLEVQMIQGLICFSVIVFLKYVINTEVPKTVVYILASSVAILIGLPLNYKHQIAPYNTTLANATFIMATGIFLRPGFYLTRMMHCLVGAVIGLMINWIIMPQHNRYLESIEEIRTCFRYYDESILQIRNPGFSGSVTQKQLAEAQSLLNTNMQHLPKDNGYAPLQKKVTAEQLAGISLLSKSVNEYAQLYKDLQCYHSCINPTFGEHLLKLCTKIRAFQDSQLNRLADYDSVSNRPEFSFPIQPQSMEETILLADLSRLLADGSDPGLSFPICTKQFEEIYK